LLSTLNSAGHTLTPAKKVVGYGANNAFKERAYVKIWHISSIRHFLSEEALKTLVSSCILSRLDYCNAPLAGCP
jgi:hypothetical protein